MTVEEAVAQSGKMPDDTVLVAKPPLTWGSDAQFVQLTDDLGVAQSIKDAGYEYLLDHEDLIHLVQFLKTKAVSRRTAAEFVIHYAMTDSGPAWIDDIPDIR